MQCKNIAESLEIECPLLHMLKKLSDDFAKNEIFIWAVFGVVIKVIFYFVLDLKMQLEIWFIQTICKR